MRFLLKNSCVLRLLLFLSLLLMVMPVGAASARIDARKIFNTAPLGAAFSYDVASDGTILILTRDNIFDASAGNYLFGESLLNPGWLAFAGGKLQFMANNGLFVVEGTSPRRLLEVFLKSRIFVSDGERTFISGITPAGKPELYIYKEGLGYKSLLEPDAPIDAMTLANGELYFAVESKIYVMKEGGSARLFAHLPSLSHIISLAVDERQSILYFSDGENIYAVRGQDFINVRQGLGGMLRYRNDNIYVLSWSSKSLYRLSGLSDTLFQTGVLVPLNDPCKIPDINLYCEAEEKRAIIKSLAAIGGLVEPDGVAGKEISTYLAVQQRELELTMAVLEQKAADGAVALIWGGGREPKVIRTNDVITTEEKGVGLTLRDGSEFRVGPYSKVIQDGCQSFEACRYRLEKGLLYSKLYEVPVEGKGFTVPRSFTIATAALSLNFSVARLAVYADGDSTAVVVLDGTVSGVTSTGGRVKINAGETLEIKRGEPPGIPAEAELTRLNRWWESIR